MFNVKIKKSLVFINLRSDVGRLPAKVPVPGIDENQKSKFESRKRNFKF